MSIRTPRGQRGITLIEIILVLAIVAAATVAIFVFSKKASVTAAVETEQRQVQELVQTIDGLFATQPNFAALGTNGAEYLKARASRANLKLTTGTDGRAAIQSGLGSGFVALTPAQVAVGGNPGVPNNGYRLAYNGLAAAECVNLVTATAAVTARVDISQNGNADTATTVAVRGGLDSDKSIIATQCATTGHASPSVYLYFLPSRAIAAASPPPSAPLARCNPVHEVQQTACPVGQTGAITQERDGACTGPGNTLVYTAWATTDTTCQVPAPGQVVVTPPTIPDNCAPFTFSRVRACPLGQIGQIVETRDVDSCAGTTTPWTLDLSATSCQTTPAATCTPATQTQAIACPAGQAGNIVQERSSSCSSPTAVPTWSAYTQTSNTCSSNAGCTVTGTCCTPQREQRDNNAACPAGTYGDLAQKEERFQGCINATTSSPGWSPWQSFSSTGSCTACPATSTETSSRWSPRSVACAVGEVGVHEWEAEEISTRDASYSCPAGSTVLPAPSYTSWSSYAETGAIRNVVNTCAPATCTGPAGETQWAGTVGVCAVGETGSNTWEREQSRSRTCNAGVWSSWSPWTDTGTTRNPVNTCAPSTCTGSSSATQWLLTVGACPAGETGTNTWEREQQQTRTCTTGSWNPWGGWTDTGTTRNPIYTCAPSTCAGSPSSTQWLPASAVCPAGETGSNTWEYEQSQTRICTAGVWGAWGGWTSTGATRNMVNTCAPSCGSGYQWAEIGFESVFNVNGNSDGVSDRGFWGLAPVVAVLHPSTPASIATAAANAKATAVQTPYTGLFGGTGYERKGSSGGSNCNSAADVGNVRYRYSYMATSFGVSMGDGGAGTAFSYDEKYEACVSVCDAQAYDPGICPVTNVGYKNNWTSAIPSSAPYYSVRNVACPAPLSGTREMRRGGACRDKNGPIEWMGYEHVGAKSCTGSIGGHAIRPDSEALAACPYGFDFNSLSWLMPNSNGNTIYFTGEACTGGTGKPGYTFFAPAWTNGMVSTPAAAVCSECLSPSWRYSIPQSVSFEANSPFCAGKPNGYEHITCPGFDQVGTGGISADPTWYGTHTSACVCNAGNNGAIKRTVGCYDDMLTAPVDPYRSETIETCAFGM